MIELLDLIYILRSVSTVTSLICAFYLLRAADHLYKLNIDNRFFVSFGIIALVWAFIKNTIPLNSSMTGQEVVSYEVFKVIVPLMVSIVCMTVSILATKGASKKIKTVSNNYIGTERRHESKS